MAYITTRGVDIPKFSTCPCPWASKLQKSTCRSLDLTYFEFLSAVSAKIFKCSELQHTSKSEPTECWSWSGSKLFAKIIRRRQVSASMKRVNILYDHFGNTSLLGKQICIYTYSNSFTILGLWVLWLAVSHINESNCKLMSLDYYFSWQVTVCNTIAS